MKNLSKMVLMQALDCAPAGMLIVHARRPGFPIAYLNAAVEVLTGYEKSDLIGRSWRILLDATEDLPAQTADILFDSAGQARTLKQRWQTKSGLHKTVELRISPLYNKPGAPAFWLLSQSISSLAQQYRQEGVRQIFSDTFLGTRQRMMRMNRHDAATGIPNRAAFIEVVERDWAIARREQRRLSVIIFRVDALEKYTDSFGRHATDATLRKVAHAITGSLRRQGDFGARFSNDRFAVLMGSADEDQVTRVAEHISHKVRGLAIHHPKSTSDRFVTVSYGIASEVPLWTAASSTLVQKAEENLVRPSSSDTSGKVAG